MLKIYQMVYLIQNKIEFEWILPLDTWWSQMIMGFYQDVNFVRFLVSITMWIDRIELYHSPKLITTSQMKKNTELGQRRVSNRTQLSALKRTRLEPPSTCELSRVLTPMSRYPDQCLWLAEQSHVIERAHCHWLPVCMAPDQLNEPPGSLWYITKHR